jgi:hypothetical protein
LDAGSLRVSGRIRILSQGGNMRFRVLVANIALLLAVLFWSLRVGLADQTPTPNPAPPAIATRADNLLTQMCEAVGSAHAFSFHAEVLFDEVLPSDVKVQFAGAMEFAVQRPDQIVVDYHSDLGAKRFWYNGDTVTLLDPVHQVYATVTVPSTIDEMLDRARVTHNLTFPLADLAMSDPCAPFRNLIVYGGYVGINDVNGVATDHLAFSSAKSDLQLWLSRSGKPVPLKVLINYRSEPGSPEYIAFLSNWKFPQEIPASRFRPAMPKDVKRIEFLKVEESKP